MNKILSKEVSYPIAKLLKEKRYDELCDGYYHHTSVITERSSVQCCNSRIADSCCTAPTIGEVVDWLIDKYEIYIISKVIKWNYEENSIRFNFEVCKLVDNNPSEEKKTPFVFDMQKEAYEEAIKYVLEYLI